MGPLFKKCKSYKSTGKWVEIYTYGFTVSSICFSTMTTSFYFKMAEHDVDLFMNNDVKLLVRDDPSVPVNIEAISKLASWHHPFDVSNIAIIGLSKVKPQHQDMCALPCGYRGKYSDVCIMCIADIKGAK
jgi:hypothetical protein